MRRVLKRSTILVVAAILVLPIGYIGAQWVWFRFHHRYDSPETGLYHGSVTALFDSLDEPFYSLRLRAESSPRWYWSLPTNFSYTSLEVEWREESTDRHATVSLPGLTYRAGDSSGAFTRDVLAGWLHGSTNWASGRQHVDAIFGYFESAARGSLPPPRHHTYYLEQPIRVQIHHFLLGYGVGSTVYIWLVVWLLLVMFCSRRLLRINRGG